MKIGGKSRSVAAEEKLPQKKEMCIEKEKEKMKARVEKERIRKEQSFQFVSPELLGDENIVTGGDVGASDKKDKDYKANVGELNPEFKIPGTINISKLTADLTPIFLGAEIRVTNEFLITSVFLTAKGVNLSQLPFSRSTVYTIRTQTIEENALAIIQTTSKKVQNSKVYLLYAFIPLNYLFLLALKLFCISFFSLAKLHSYQLLPEPRTAAFIAV